MGDIIPKNAAAYAPRLHLRRRNTANADSKIQLAMGMGDFERRPENAIETKTASAKSGW
jgi:hypothetical protein